MAIVNAGQGEPSQWVRAATSAATTTTSPKPNSASLPSREKRMGSNGVRLKPDPQETRCRSGFSPTPPLNLPQIAAQRIAHQMRADLLPAAALNHMLDMRTMRTLGFPGLYECEHALVGGAVEDANGLAARHLREVRLDLLQDLPERREFFAAGFEGDDQVNQGSLSASTTLATDTTALSDAAGAYSLSPSFSMRR